ncbi:KAP family NTPase [Photobacterium profundum]|uniref:KAP family P-loop NTPase fold protein n=1 Tax=Photobacterium profundum TaxID=74109 RepID=UPI003D128EB9
MKTDVTFSSRDEYNRKKTADGILKLFANDNLGISRLLINGDWGEGKTEFCHKLLNHFGDNYHLVYVDAFAADSIDNSLLTLTANIAKLLPKGKTRTRFIKKAMPALKVGTKTLGKAGISWLFKQNAEDINDDYEKELQKGVEQLSDLAVEAALNEQVEAEKNIEALKSALELLTTGDDGKPLIICIDEFDRCRPPYAISMLETVKHFFDADKVNFVFCANKEILEQSIKHHYGVEDATRYLDKFMDFTIELPRTPHNYFGSEFEYNRASVSHLVSELNKYELNDVSARFQLSGSRPTFFLEMLERVPTFTLRDAEVFARNIAIYDQISGINWQDEFQSSMAMLGIMAYTFYKADFENLEKGEYSQQLVMKHFISYENRNEFTQDRGFKSFVFAALEAGKKPRPLGIIDKVASGEGDLVSKTNIVNSNLQYSDIDDLKDLSKQFSVAYKFMLNLA